MIGSKLGRGLDKLRQSTPGGRAAKQAEDDEARATQTQLLPQTTPQFAGFEIACVWQPSAEVSGDYFDVFPLPDDRMALCIADVSGKGMAAALLMKELHDAVWQFAPGAGSPAELCTEVNQALCGLGPQTRYATMFYGMLEAGGLLRFESAGHCLPLLVRGDGSVWFPASFSGVIGIFSHWLYQNQEVQIHSGDRLLLMTDGLLLAENRRNQEFGYQRLIAVVEKSHGSGAEKLGEEILAAVTRFTGGRLQDDASLIVVQRK
jgi:phosphoserine phosphatase RsbU/P